MTIEEQPATQPTQGITMDNIQAPNLVGIIMQALESHITNLVDQRLNERMAEIKMPNLDEIKDSITEMIDEKMADHESSYDHDEYDSTVRTVDEAGLDDIEETVKEVMRNVSVTLDL